MFQTGRICSKKCAGQTKLPGAWEEHMRQPPAVTATGGAPPGSAQRYSPAARPAICLCPRRKGKRRAEGCPVHQDRRWRPRSHWEAGALQHRRNLQRQAGTAVSRDLRGRQAPRGGGEKSKIARQKTQRRQQKRGAARHNAKAHQAPREGKPLRRATGCKAWLADGMGRRAGHYIGMWERAAPSARGGSGVPGMGGTNGAYSHSTSPLLFT